MVILFFVLSGLMFGSFANVCIYRWPREGSVLSPRRSYCPWCERPLPWFENIPLGSFFYLKGKCRGCSSPISWRYPVVEFLMAFFWGLTVWLSIPLMTLASWFIL